MMQIACSRSTSSAPFLFQICFAAICCACPIDIDRRERTIRHGEERAREGGAKKKGKSQKSCQPGQWPRRALKSPQLRTPRHALDRLFRSSPKCQFDTFLCRAAFERARSCAQGSASCQEPGDARERASSISALLLPTTTTTTTTTTTSGERERPWLPPALSIATAVNAIRSLGCRLLTMLERAMGKRSED